MKLLDRLLARPTSVTHAEARRRTSDDGVVVYWRPGCPFCQRLTLALRGPGRRATWVNIWADPEAAAFVRSVNGGDETVPTVVIDGTAHTNPASRLVRDALAA